MKKITEDPVPCGFTLPASCDEERFADQFTLGVISFAVHDPPAATIRMSPH